MISGKINTGDGHTLCDEVRKHGVLSPACFRCLCKC